MEYYAPGGKKGGSFQGQAHPLGRQGPEGGVDGTGTEVVKGAVDGDAPVLLSEGGGKRGDFLHGDRLEGVVAEVDLGIQRVVEKEGELSLQLEERDVGLNLGERLSRQGTAVLFDA